MDSDVGTADTGTMPDGAKPPTILLVDDERHLVSLVRFKLEKKGYVTLIAHDGERALAIATEHAPDLVVTDFQMPRMDGLQFATALEEADATTGTPVILVSGRGYSLSPTDLARTGIRHILPKPFSPSELLFHVDECLAELGWKDAA